MLLDVFECSECCGRRLFCLIEYTPGRAHSLSRLNGDAIRARRSIVSESESVVWAQVLRDRRFATALFWAGVVRISM